MPRPWRQAALAFAAYAALTVLLTWPLARGLTRDLPADLGDPVLNVFLLGWDLKCLGALARFEPGAWERLWNAPIFHPDTLTLAYSEHFFGQALQAWPLHALGAKPVLVYNALFLASFALSGLGAFLLVRELTASARAGFLAGLFFGFALYRFGQLSHLQVLSSHPLPYVLYFLTRYARTGSRAALFGAALALWLQNLSNGYYLLFFTPFALLYAVAALAFHGRLRERRAWLALALAGLLVAGLTWPFVRPYLEVHARGVILRERAVVAHFSPSVLGYLTAPFPLRLWGPLLQPSPVVENSLFPGCVPLALGLLGLLASLPLAAAAPVGRSRREWLARGLLGLAAVHLVLAVPLLSGEVVYVAGLRLASLMRLLAQAALAAVAAFCLSPRLRAAWRGWLLSPPAFFALALLTSVWLSLGPVPMGFERPLHLPSLYALLYDYVPGFDGLRVPGRLGLLVALWLAVLAGYGAARLLAGLGTAGARGLTALLGLAFLVEAWAVPLPLNLPFDAPNLRPLPAHLLMGAEAPPIYRAIERLPATAVLAELPFGTDAYDLRYMAAALGHGRRLMNGFSGGLSSEQGTRRVALRSPLILQALAWQALTSAGATHVVVHVGAWRRERYGERIVAWLEGRGARVLAREKGDVLLELPAR